MDIGEGGMRSSEENEFNGFQLLNSQGRWLRTPPVKPVPGRWQTANGDGEFRWLNSLGLSPALYTPQVSLHNAADLTEASRSGSAMTSRGNQIGDLNFSTDLYGNDSAAAGGFRSNCHGGSVPSCFTEDLASVCTQITSDSLHHTVPKTTHSQNDVGWPHREAQNPIPFTHPSIMGNWSWPQSHLATMSHMTQNSSPNSYNNLAYGINIPSQNSYNNFVYGINTPSQSLSTSDKVAPLTPEKDSWRGVDICSSTCIDPSLTRQLLIDVASNVKQQTGVIQQHDLPHFEQQVQTGQLYNGYYAAQASTYEFPDSYGKVVYGIKPTSTDAATFGTNSTVDTNAIFIPITPEKLANTGTRCSRSSIVNLPMPWELQGDHGSQKETHQPDEVVSKVISDTSLLEPSIIQDNGLKHLTDPQQNQTVSLIKERNGGLEKVSDDGVDLNKTPSQKPKRRKIRPKVVREDKPKRPSNKEQVPQTPGEIPAERKKRPYRRKTHESPTTDAADPVDAPSERKKRPYVRKTKETPTSGTADLETNAISPNATGIATCKRSLIFDFDAQARQYDCSSYLQPNPHKPIPDNQDGAAAVNTIGCATFDLNRPNNNVSFPEIFGASLVQRKDSTQRSSEDRARNNNGLGKVGEKHQEGLSTESGIRILQSTTGSSAVLPNTAGKDEKTVPPQCQSITTQTSTMYALNMLTNQHGPTGPTISPNLTMDMFQQHTRDMILLRISESCGQSLEGLQKRIKEGTQRPDDPCHKVPKDQTPEKQPEELQSCKEYTSTSSAVSSVHQSVNPNKSNSKSFTEASVMYSSREGKAVDVMQHKCANHKDQLDVDQQYTQMNSNAAEKLSAFQHVQEHNCMSAQMEDMRNRRSSIYPNQIYRPFTLFPATGHSSMTQQCVQESFNDHVTQLSHAALPTGRAHPKEPKKRGRKQNPEKNASSNAPALLKSNLQANLNINFLPKAMNPIDEIIYNLKKLDIGSKTDEHAIVAVENAIVPYVAEGTIIPYEPRRRRPRPKVDLDDETTRVWKLLMGSSWEGIDGSDADKEKWWEEERRVFRGRADSFIARMHLVQGDRRFSQWKGSVVDSVVGVFLTQNVSDHLSSSAFMALAARFALKEEAEFASLGNNESIISAVTDQVSPARNLHEATECTKSSSIMKVVPTSLDSEHSEHKESILPQKINIAESCGNEIQESASSTSNLQAASEEVAKLMEPEDGNSVCFSVISSQDSTDSNAQAVDQTGSTAEFSIMAEEPIGRGTYSNLLQGSFSELLRVAGTPALFKDLCAKENLYLSLGQKIRTTSDLLLHGNWDPNVNKVSEADSSFEIGNKGNTTDMTTNFSAEGSSHTTAFSLENQATSFLNKATDSRFDSFQQGNQTKQQANFHSPTEVKDVNVNTLEHAGSIENQESVESKLGVSKVKSDGKPRQKVFRAKKGDSRSTKEKWDPLRREAMEKVGIKERCPDKKDSLDWEAVRHANVNEIADTIKERGMNHMLAARIQEFLNRLVEDHGSIDLEWLRDVPPDKAKDFLLSINGLGLKSVECVRLLTLHHLAFPVDTNVGRICVRLGWVPLQPLPESLQLHLLELYPVLESIQKYLWPRLCKLDQRTLYELHYQLITFGKVFCTKSRPNCNACPMRGECRHFASAFASARFALPGPEEKSLVSSTGPFMSEQESQENFIHSIQLSPPKELPPAVEYPTNQKNCNLSECEPIIEEPKTPEAEPEYVESSESAIEDFNYEDPDEIPTIKLNLEELTVQVQNYIKDKKMVLQDPDMSKALVALTPEAASIPTPKLKNVSRLRTEHQVYELPDNHPLLDGLDKREPDDPCTYLLAIWTPGETAESVEPPKACCDFEASGNLCDRETCFSCNAIRETNAQTVRGTLLIPCRTAMRGSFPLNGTYFQVNEVFADHESSLNPIAVSRELIWNLPRRTVYFGTSVTSIFKGLTTEGIQYCFWRGFVCVRGFDQKKRAPRPLMARLHFPASKQTRDKRKVATGLDE